MKKFALLGGGLAFGLLLVSPLAIGAQDDIVAHVAVGSNQASVTQADVTAMLKSLNPDVRSQFTADPKKLDQLVRSRLAVQAVLAEAHGKGWENQPQVQALIDDARREVILRSYLASVSTPPADYPSDADIQSVYEHNQSSFAVPRALRIAQIYISVPADADAATVEKARQRAANLAHQLHGSAANFAALAQASSDDKASAARGGDLGFMADAELLPEIRNATAGMKPGDVAGPIQTKAGFHVIKLLDVHAAETAPLADVKERIRAEMRQQRQQREAQAYMVKLMGSGSATIDDEALKKTLAAVQ